jgi:hypothetical protein
MILRNLKNNTKRSIKYPSNEYEIPNNIYPNEFEIREEYDIDIPEYPLSTFKDYKLPPLKKKYSRPYFSPYPNSLEMDIMVVPLPSNINKVFRNYKANDGNKNLNYIFIINISTKYLFVFSSFKKDTSSIINCLKSMMYVYDIKINNIRGDDDSTFRNNLRNLLKEKELFIIFHISNKQINIKLFIE